MIKESCYILFFVCMFSLNVKAQFYDEMFLQTSVMDSSQSKFAIKIRNHNFFKNNEYFNDYAYSYTLLGAFLSPELEYKIKENLSLACGLYMQKFSGKDDLNKIKPIYRVVYCPFRQFSITMGNIKGGAEHRLTDQIYCADRHIIDNNEEGLQFLFSRNNWFGDLWLNWDNTAFPNDRKQEQLQLGFSGEAPLLNKKGSLLMVKAQVLWAHNGGQDLAVSYDVRTIGSVAGGVRFRHSFDCKAPLGFGAEILYVACRDLSPFKKMPYSEGYGLHSMVSAYFSYFSLDVAHWYGYHYFTAFGEPLYQSVSQKWGSSLAPERNVFTLKAAFTRQVADGLKIVVHYGGFLGKDIESFDYFYGMHLIINQNLLIRNKNIR